MTQDTAQRRAEAIACEIHFLNIEHVTEHPRYCDEGYDGGCGGQDGECDVLKTAKIVKEALRQARREALEEAAKVAREFKGGFTLDVFSCKLIPDKDGPWTLGTDIATAIDRLREGVEG